MFDLEDLDYKLIPLKSILTIGTAKFMHGDVEMYGENGSKLEKVSRTCGHSEGFMVFLGHIHYPSIRFGSFSVGFSGLMDQSYNEPNTSTWIHGFGMCNQYKSVSFPTTVAIFENRCILWNKTYIPKNPESWNINSFKARILYETK